MCETYNETGDLAFAKSVVDSLCFWNPVIGIYKHPNFLSQMSLKFAFNMGCYCCGRNLFVFRY
jgi:hypothetical protein